MDKGRKKALKEKKRKDARRKAEQQASGKRTVSQYLSESLALMQRRKDAQAEALIRKGMQQFPESPELYSNLVHAVYMQGRGQDAIEVAEKCVAQFPEFPDGHNNLGVVNKFEGRMDIAQAAYRKALDLAPKNGDYWRNYTAVKKFQPEDVEELQALEALAEQRRHDARTNPAIFFAIGKALEDITEYDRAFSWYRKGNQVVRSRARYRREHLEALVDELIAKQGAEFFAQTGPATPCPEQPILVVGSPRSGSTLIEQVLATHPELEGSGEESDLQAALIAFAPKGTPGQDGKQGIHFESMIPMAQRVVELADPERVRLARVYSDRQQKRVPGSHRIVDKYLSNFLNLGVLYHSMPGARFLYSRREAMATCFSNYKIMFTSIVPQAYDFGDLAHYYHQVDRLMDHWQKHMPERILVVDYEEMVDDLEGQTRRMLDFAGLDWHPDCMQFFENKRRVTSASATQVRKPVYKSSLAYWKNFETHLEPLQQALQEFGYDI